MARKAEEYVIGILFPYEERTEIKYVTSILNEVKVAKMFRITKGSDHNCTTWYKNGNNWSWHHGIGCYTLVADSVWNAWREIESIISEEGININKIGK